MAKGACGTTRGMAQQLWSSYYYKLDAKLKAGYQEKVSLIKQEDPYAFKKATFAVIRSTCLVLGKFIC